MCIFRGDIHFETGGTQTKFIWVMKIVYVFIGAETVKTVNWIEWNSSDTTIMVIEEKLR